MSDLSARLSLPYLQAAQAQKHVTHNEALERLDLLVQLTVQAFDATTPPTSPEEGQIWALGAAPAGDWAMHPQALAAWSNGGWLFITPQAGWRATQGDELRIWSGAGWELPTPALDNLPGLGINASHDATNRLLVAADAALFTHDGEGHQLKINKAGIGDTGSLLFQTGFSGRAEMGLAGEDDFSFKVSPDGSAWHTALTIDAGSGNVQMPQSLSVSGTMTANLTGNVTGNVTGGLTGGPIEDATIGADTPASGAFTALSAESFLGLPAEDIIEAVLEAMARRLAQIFRLGEDGTLASDPLQAFTDTAATAAADLGDSIARVDDLSGNARHAVQASAALRPLLGRAPVGAAPGGAVDQGSGPPFIRFDLSDDVLPTTFPDGGTFDVMIFGRQGSWIERDVAISPGGSLNIGPTTITGGPDGLMDGSRVGPVLPLGDIVGWTAVDRTLTEAEIARLVQYHKARGAKGLLVPGPELVTNHDFSDGSTGWELGAGWSISGGQASCDGSQTDFSELLVESYDVTEGNVYLVQTDISAVSAGFFRPRFAGVVVQGVSRSAAGSYRDIMVAQISNNAPRLRAFSSFVGTVDQFSIRELRPQEDW